MAVKMQTGSSADLTVSCFGLDASAGTEMCTASCLDMRPHVLHLSSCQHRVAYVLCCCCCRRHVHRKMQLIDSGLDYRTKTVCAHRDQKAVFVRDLIDQKAVFVPI